MGSLLASGVLRVGYAGASIFIATQASHMPRKSLVGAPGDYGPKVADATFPARDDGVHIKGWFILGVLPDVRLTADARRT